MLGKKTFSDQRKSPLKRLRRQREMMKEAPMPIFPKIPGVPDVSPSTQSEPAIDAAKDRHTSFPYSFAAQMLCICIQSKTSCPVAINDFKMPF